MENQDGARKTVRVERQPDGVAVIALNRPEKKNALTLSMWRELAEIVVALGGDEEVRAIVLTSNGTDFCAGADIKEFDSLRGEAGTARQYEAFNSAAFAAFRNASVPTIAAIGGVCFGGGFGLAASCDLRIATPEALFSIPAARLGLAYPVDAMADIVHALGPQLARYLAYSGARIDARQAQAAGFVLELTEERQLRSRGLEIASQVAANAPLSVRASKAAIAAVLSGRAEDMENARRIGDQTFDSSDYGEGRIAFRDRRAPRFSGH